MGEQHDYRYFRGGAPTDTDYQWCSRCGVLKAMPSGDPDTYYEPGAFRFDPYGTPVEPSCRGLAVGGEEKSRNERRM